MSVLKCKMCGGSLKVNDDSGVAVCEYCGTRQTISKTNDDVISNLYNRANNLRLKNEFDKALSVYEKIVEQDDSEAEAHWGLVLCKYGIEYVDDPETGKKIPTCHRTSFESVKKDIDYQAAIDYSSVDQQLLYEEEAREIDRLQKEILNIARNEKPFDVFICYKETDENGKRTIDSVIANDIYYQLTQEGFKVFYAAITLEDKLGQEYEPYIFAALNSAKVMLVIGTKPEYFNAVWVKNEWSRFLSLMKKDRTKILIPCYRDMDAYDLPDEFAHLQAQDMSKIGFINDVIRGIRKILIKDSSSLLRSQSSMPDNVPQINANNSSLLKRASMFLEDGDFKSADEYYDRILDNDPENGEAYLGKLLAELHVKSIDQLSELDKPFKTNTNFSKIIRYCSNEVSNRLNDINEEISNRNEVNGINAIYNEALQQKDKARTVNEFNQVISSLKSISQYRDVESLIDECNKEKELIAAKQKTIIKYYIPAVIAVIAIVIMLIPFISIIFTDGTLHHKKVFKQSIKVGDTVLFGRYEQDNDTTNGKELITWIVLSKNDRTLTLISKNALDNQPFNNESTHVSWGNSSLRKWMNSDFYNAAFSLIDKSVIASTNVDGTLNDKVFLLKQSQAMKFFANANNRRCVATRYALANGATRMSNNCSDWWIRDSATRHDQYYVDEFGFITKKEINSSDCTVRPVIQVYYK